MAELKLREIVRRFGDRVVLDNLSLEAAHGETIAILGPSGSGKSSLLNLIGGLDRPDAGSIVVDGIEVHRLAGRELADYRATRVGFVFQEHHLLPQLSARENVLLPTIPRSPNKPAPSLLDATDRLLALVGLASLSNAFPAEMSGGERQRVAVARALINEPSLLLCDEPTGNLDRETGAKVVDLLRGLSDTDAGLRVTVIMATHNIEHAARFDRRLALLDGRLIADKG